jgi:hypothetical protein
MTVATVHSVHLSESLQSLIDSRLDTIERMLLGRVSRAERMGIVREVELQIHELLEERHAEELSREDVLAVLARLDPPEAYLPDETEREPSADRRPVAARALPVGRKADGRTARTSGIVGLLALSMLLLCAVGYLIAALFNSEILAVFLCGGALALMFIGSVVGLSLGIYARMGGPWAVVGMVTSILALLFSLGSGMLLPLLIDL